MPDFGCLSSFISSSQSQKFADVVDLSYSFLLRSNPTKLSLSVNDNVLETRSDARIQGQTVNIRRRQLSVAQKSDPSLSRCIESAVNTKDEIACVRIGYYWDGDVLMCKWLPISGDATGLDHAQQIVVPMCYRSVVLELAHDHVMAGHFGVNKTFQCVGKYFYWPGLKTSVAKYCRSYHACQIAGKPNQVVRPAPLHPIPVVGEPFEWLILDCVGPLCSLFGLQLVIQTDRGTNFTSKLFNQVLTRISVYHQMSSAYHPQSQGALERFHQTLKTMLRVYCIEAGKDWADSLPLLLFAIQETVQDSLGFSPAQLVFGHSIRGPLRLLSDQLLENETALVLVTEHVDTLRKRLRRTCEITKLNLASSQAVMKECYDRKSVVRSFEPGESVLALLPIPGSSLQSRFTGPYIIERKVCETNYVLKTPDHRKKTRMCHINMLKPYHARDGGPICSPEQLRG